MLLYTAVSSELAQATQKDQKTPKMARGILQKSKSMTVQNFVEEIRWMKVRNVARRQHMIFVDFRLN